MTPINLMAALVHRVRNATKDYKFRASDGEGFRAPKVWAQHLPEKLYDDTVDPADYPFVQIVLGGGLVVGLEDGDSTVNAAIMVGGYDDGQPADPEEPSVRDQQGWLIPAEIMWRIISDLETHPIVGGKYQLQHPLTWELPAEQPAPLWYGLISASFSVPVPRQAFGFEYWTQDPTVPPDGPHTEEVKT